MVEPEAPDPTWGGYTSLAPPPPSGVFELGLVMAGAISAGAYTAGVIDFLIEALDTWEAAKRVCEAANSDPRQWDIPGHRLQLRVVSGASAGAMTGAIAAVALRYQFPHIRDPAAGATSPLYKPWVKDIDISYLLQHRDLPRPDAPVTSMLDSSALLKILQSALDFEGPTSTQRPYLEPAVRFIFTEGNLRGIPYFLSMRGNTTGGLSMIAHSDYQSYYVAYAGSAQGCARADDVPVHFPNSSADPQWKALGAAALSSGAFPIGLAPRAIERNGADFNYRFVIVPGDQGQPPQVARLQPLWNAAATAPSLYSTFVVDGGTMNNDPLELARTHLAGLLGRNPRDGSLANRAIVLVDPFPDLAGAMDDPTRGQITDVFGAAISLMGAWKDQARFNAQDLALAADENTYSRFMVAPSRAMSPVSNGFALACGALGGFSGFLSEKFRSHDYLLGRRNCQEFLRSHFCLPADNIPVFGVVNPSLKSPGSPWLAPGSGPPSMPIVPLIGDLAKPEPLPEWPKGAFQPDSLRAPATARINKIFDHVLRNSVHLNWCFQLLAKFGLAKVRSTAIDRIIEIVRRQLNDRALM